MLKKGAKIRSKLNVFQVLFHRVFLKNEQCGRENVEVHYLYIQFLRLNIFFFSLFIAIINILFRELIFLLKREFIFLCRSKSIP